MTIGTRPRRKAAPRTHEFVDTTDPMFSTGSTCEACTTTTTNWFGANKPLAIPFFLDRSRIVYQLGWCNGSVASDSMDIGIYDTSWNRLVSGGGTARSGTSTYQLVNVTDTALQRGRYWLAAVSNGVTSNAQTVVSGATNVVSFVAFLGVYDSATNAYPLPNPLTNMAAAATATRVPGLVIVFRAAP